MIIFTMSAFQMISMENWRVNAKIYIQKLLWLVWLEHWHISKNAIQWTFDFLFLFSAELLTNHIIRNNSVVRQNDELNYSLDELIEFPKKKIINSLRVFSVWKIEHEIEIKHSFFLLSLIHWNCFHNEFEK